MQIIGIKVIEGALSVIKNLKPGTWYPFGDYIEPTELNDWRWEKDEDDGWLSSVYKAATEETFPENLQISVSCIVGQNGSGKTTLLELMFRIINNFAYTVLDKKRSKKEQEMFVQTGRELCEATGFAASLFFETDGNLGIIEYQYGNIKYRYLAKAENSRIEMEEFNQKFISQSKRKKLLAGFFYTICTNYSIHSFCEKDYSSETLIIPEGQNGVNGKWIKGLLHKNDGYLAPMAVVPYRDSWGNIDIANEKELADQRLATLSLLFWSQEKSFMEKYKPAYIEYRFDDKCTTWHYNKFHSLCNERLPMNVKEYETIFNEFHGYWNVILSSEYERFNRYSADVQNAILTYLTYKTVKICLNYPSFGILLGIRKLTDKEIEIVRDRWERNSKNRHKLTDSDIKYMSIATLPQEYYKKIVNKILSLDEQTHITLKIRQILEFLKRGYYEPIVAAKESDEYPISVKKIAVDRIIADNLEYDNATLPEGQKKKRYSRYDEVFEILPPAIFEWQLYLLPKSTKLNRAMDNGLLMNKMSSGERQMLQSASYMLYHIKNIESIREDNNRKAYRHINIVLDEAELYYHPEMQRTMIANIIKMLSWCHINNTKIRSVHIMLVTHSPFVLSDVPKNRILYMKDGNTAKKDNQTFAANIHDLLYNQFFIENPIGEVAYSSVKKVVNMYNEFPKLTQKDKEQFYSNINYYRKIINLIGEPYLHNTLTEMLDFIIMESGKHDEIKAEQEKLKRRLNHLENLLRQK